MILVDSCGWIEYLTDYPLADKYDSMFKFFDLCRKRTSTRGEPLWQVYPCS
ncbi:hypothetical protein KKE26_02605 [bacterium]|nr:hypothetical protein [bacterium]